MQFNGEFFCNQIIAQIREKLITSSVRKGEETEFWKKTE